jgi:hypothetical protein
MSNVVTTANMGLTLPIPGVETGPNYALDINNSLSTIDSHSHNTGSGVPITPSAMNINSALVFNNHDQTGLRSSKFQAQSSPLALATDLGCLYVSGADLYFNDENGNQVRLTQSGSIVGTAGSISGLPSGTASASYASSTFVFQSATNTAASIDGASILLRNATASSKALTLSPPNAMASNYGLTLPALPVSQKIMTLDASGNISAPYTVDNSTIEINANTIRVKANGITASQLANATITTTQISGSAGITGSQIAATTITASNIVNNTITATQIANATITSTQMANSSIGTNQIITNTISTPLIIDSAVTQSKLGSLNYAYSSVSYNGTVTSATPTLILQVALNVVNRPVMIRLQPTTSSGVASYFQTFGYEASMYLVRDATEISRWSYAGQVPASSFSFFDIPGAGGHTYYIYIWSPTTNSITVPFTRLLAYEL